MRDRARRTTQATSDVERRERAATRERRLRVRYGVSGGYTGTGVVWSYQKGKKDERCRCRTHAYDNCVTPRLETRAGKKRGSGLIGDESRSIQTLGPRIKTGF